MSNIKYGIVAIRKLNINNVKREKVLVSKILVYAFPIILSLICIFPFYVLLVNSTQSDSAVAQNLALLPGSEFFNNYKKVTHFISIWTCLKNSLISATITTAISAYIGALAAFAFAKYNFKGKSFLFYIVIVALILPPQIGIIGLYNICILFKIRGTLLLLILPAIANSGFVIFVRYYIQSTISDSVIYSAKIDGCGEFKIFNFIVLPMIIPAIAVMSILTFIACWNNFLVPVTFNSDNERLWTMPLIPYLFRGTYGGPVQGSWYCSLAVSILPVTAVFFFLSKFIISGLTSGTVKE